MHAIQPRVDFDSECKRSRSDKVTIPSTQMGSLLRALIVLGSGVAWTW